ncbi:sensor domain-containing diguanylate cyclase [Acinetobacter sp. Marseille-Q1618]|uniref:GGDEF domain-containing protein n=1 Tax=Acinetobacter sp. Marseille-Q1618 TaxID=2697502 RepID=UPI00156E228B|nr:sensor domain-containing diguanylate cyclase [Acinetobacter sp. Marseille-Q1618]
MENERSHLHQILSNVDFIQTLKSVEKLDLVSFISKLPLPVAILEFDSRLLVVNQQFADIFQSDALFLNGKLLSTFSSSLYADFELALEKFATGEKQVDFEFYSKGHFYLSYFKAMYSADQQINAVILICADVTRLKRREKVLMLNNQKLHDHLFIDHITGLPNKMAFDQYLQEKLFENLKDKYTFLKIDLDHFKKFNQLHSYTRGDQVLMEIGNILDDELNPDYARIFRLNSSSFVIVIKDMTPWAVFTLAERLKMRISQENIAIQDSQNAVLTACIGIYHLALPYHAHDILQQLDLAVYHAKQQGANSIYVLNG